MASEDEQLRTAFPFAAPELRNKLLNIWARIRAGATRGSLDDAEKLEEVKGWKLSRFIIAVKKHKAGLESHHVRALFEEWDSTDSDPDLEEKARSLRRLFEAMERDPGD